MSKDNDYTDIERPYGEHLEREAETLAPDLEEEGVVGAAVQSNVQTSSGDYQPIIKNPDQLDDLYIKNFIKSFDWKPKKQGFYLDGATGYAEFADVYITGSIVLDTSSYLAGGQTDFDNGVGFFLGYSGGDYKFSIGNSALGPKVTWDGTALVVEGADLSAPGVNSDLALMAWQFDGAFAAADEDTVNWTAGDLTFQNGVTYSILSGGTGNMAAKTYIYFDKDVSTTAFQISTTASDAIGSNKLLVGIAENTADPLNNAEFQVFGGSGGFSRVIGAESILAGSITANRLDVNELSAISADLGTITAGTITGATVRTAASGDRVQMLDSTNTIQILDAAGVVRAESFENGWEFSSSAGTTRGRLYVDNTLGIMVVQGVSNDLVLGAADDITFIPGNGSTPTAFFRGSNDNFVISTGDFELGDTTIVGGGSWTLTLPSTNGSPGEFLQTDGSGNTTWAASSGGADTDLNNLTTTSINQSLIPADSVVDLGSSALPWDRLYVDDIYLNTADAQIFYGTTLAIDFYTDHLRLGSGYDDFSPASALGGNLGDTFPWNAIFCDTLDVADIDISGDITFSTGEFITSGTDMEYNASSDHIFYIGGVLQAIIDNNIYTEGDLLAGGSKPFVIPHPDGSDRLLRYTAQESPEVLLRHRGKAQTNSLGECIITLPTHFTLVTDASGDVTVNITPVGDNHLYLTDEPTNATVNVSGSPDATFHYEVIAVRDGFLNAAVEIDATDKDTHQRDVDLVNKINSITTKTELNQEKILVKEASLTSKVTAVRDVSPRLMEKVEPVISKTPIKQ